MKPIPTIQEITETISNDFKSRLNLVGQLKKWLGAFAAVLGVQFKLNYNFLGDIENNVFPDKADTEANGGTLERQGRIWIGRNPYPASSGVFTLSVDAVAGSVLRSSLTFKSNDGSKNPGKLYVLDAEYIATGSGDEIEVRSLGGGADFDLDIGDTLTITEPVIGVQQTVTVIGVIEQPRAAEDIEVYREAVLNSRQLEPQGGAKTDYRLWASDAQGVRKVYPYVRNNDAGIVDVYVEATKADSTDGNGTPSGALLTDVEEVIEFDPDETKPDFERGRRPIQANVQVSAISLIEVDVVITDLFVDNSDVRASIESNLETYLYDVRPYIPGADLNRNKNNILYEARLQAVVTDSLDNSNFFTAFNMIVGGTSVDAYQFNLGNIPVLNSVTYITS